MIPSIILLQMVYSLLPNFVCRSHMGFSALDLESKLPFVQQFESYLQETIPQNQATNCSSRIIERKVQGGVLFIDFSIIPSMFPGQKYNRVCFVSLHTESNLLRLASKSSTFEQVLYLKKARRNQVCLFRTYEEAYLLGKYSL